MAKVLVTGGSGFIGGHLVRALRKQGDEVTCLVRRTSPVARLERLGVARMLGDVTDLESLKAAVAGKSVVYHLAGLVTGLHAREMYRVNQGGTANVARACAERPEPPLLVYVSSLAAAGPSTPERLRVETDPTEPISVYGRSKRAGEVAAQRYADRVPITVIRPPIVLGEGDRVGLPLFQSVARWGVHVVGGLAPRRFSVIHADDLAEGLILAARRGERLLPPADNEPPRWRGFYFVGDDEHPEYGDLGRMVGAAVGRRGVRVIRIPVPLVWTVAGGVQLAAHLRGRALFLGLDKAREICAPSWTCSPRKAIDQLGFRVAAPLAERLRQTAAWYRSEGWL